MELKMPLLTAEYLKERLRVEKSVEEFEKDVQAMLESQKKDEEMKRREDELYEKVKNATTLDLAPELIDTEIQEMVQDLHERLAKQNMSMDQWLAQTKKDAKTVLEEMKDIAKSRLTLRFGMQEMTKEKKVVVAEEEMVKELDLMRKYAEKNGHSMSEEGYAKGGSVYEAIRIDLAVQSLIKTMIA
jgi:FKBP-type peptidyl-prolyl cis-trans isomerase (trigger factor)